MATLVSPSSADQHVPVHWLWMIHGQRAGTAWTQRTRFSIPSWYIPLGVVTRHGLLVHDQMHPWLSARQRKIWQKLRYGCSGDQMDSISREDFMILFATEEKPWNHGFIDLVGVFLDTWDVKGWAGYANPLQSVLATLRWHSLWRRTERSGRPGWQHPQWTWLFIPDWEPLIPFNTRLAWSDDATALGAWIAQIIPDIYDTDPHWLSEVPATQLTVLGMQFAVWQAMGLGYFDRVEEGDNGSSC